MDSLSLDEIAVVQPAVDRLTNELSATVGSSGWNPRINLALPMKPRFEFLLETFFKQNGFDVEYSDDHIRLFWDRELVISKITDSQILKAKEMFYEKDISSSAFTVFRDSIITHDGVNYIIQTPEYIESILK